MKIKKSHITGTVVIVLGVLGIFLVSKALQSPPPPPNPDRAGIKAVVYKTPTCGCCGNYVAYLRKRGFDVEVNNVQSTTEINNQYKIPQNLLSCHTTVIGDYVVEGHIPTEAIDKLLSEKPDVKGIALAGMPSGSPGMPGAKTEPFEIHNVTKNGEDGGIFWNM